MLGRVSFLYGLVTPGLGLAAGSEQLPLVLDYLNRTCQGTDWSKINLLRTCCSSFPHYWLRKESPSIENRAQRTLRQDEAPLVSHCPPRSPCWGRPVSGSQGCSVTYVMLRLRTWVLEWGTFCLDPTSGTHKLCPWMCSAGLLSSVFSSVEGGWWENPFYRDVVKIKYILHSIASGTQKISINSIIVIIVIIVCIMHISNHCRERVSLGFP